MEPFQDCFWSLIKVVKICFVILLEYFLIRFCYYIPDSICNLLRVTRPLTRLGPNISTLFPFISSISCSIQFRPCSNAPRHTYSHSGLITVMQYLSFAARETDFLLHIAIYWYKLLVNCSVACNFRIICDSQYLRRDHSNMASISAKAKQFKSICNPARVDCDAAVNTAEAFLQFSYHFL